MLRMVSYFRRSQSGQIMCYLNRTYHVLLTWIKFVLDFRSNEGHTAAPLAGNEQRIIKIIAPWVCGERLPSAFDP